MLAGISPAERRQLARLLASWSNSILDADDD